MARRKSIRMKELIRIANTHYPDGAILEHWDMSSGQPVEETRGDSLAHFVVREIFSTFEAGRPDVTQIQDAALRMTVAARDLLVLSVGLINEADCRRIAGVPPASKE